MFMGCCGDRYISALFLRRVRSLLSICHRSYNHPLKCCKDEISGLWSNHLTHFAISVGYKYRISNFFCFCALNKQMQFHSMLWNWKEHSKMAIILPGDSSSSSRKPPSFGSRSGAPYHFLNFGPPANDTLCQWNMPIKTKGHMIMYHHCIYIL